MTQRTRPAILIVEDEVIVARDLQQTLIDLGYDAFAVASSASEAIARATERCPDLALMDIRIRGVPDGIETARVLGERFGVAIVFLTAHADDSTLERAKVTNPHGYLLKPVSSSALVSAIEMSLYRHEVERQARERERQLSTALQSVTDAVLGVDLAGRITFMNPAAEALTGTSAAEAVGKRASDVMQGEGSDASDTASDEPPMSQAMRELRRVEAKGGSLLNAATGARHATHGSAAPVLDAGQPIGAVMVLRDVTQQERVQRQLEFADRLASLGTMAAGVAHEVNNPLSVVLANVTILCDDIEDHRADLERRSITYDAQRLQQMLSSLGDVRSAADRIRRIMLDLLAFSRRERPDTGFADVRRCVEWATRTTSHEFKNRARVSSNVGQLPNVAGDDARLVQVLVNLLINAAHAIEPGHTDENRVSVDAGTREDGWVQLEVSDTGSGIPPEILGRIFEPFFTTKGVEKGTGLGLSICHGIVTSFGGKLEVASELGKGTRFTISLPPAQPSPKPAPPPAAEREKPLAQARVLVIDDEPQVLRFMQRVLREHSVTCFEDAREALSLIDRGEPFDVVLSDLMMPSMTGMAFYEALLERQPELAKRVVFLSGGATLPNVDAFLRAVSNPRMDKPFAVEKIRSIVNEMARSKVAGG
jgi:PAS domain S-box-containing protein